MAAFISLTAKRWHAHLLGEDRLPPGFYIYDHHRARDTIVIDVERSTSERCLAHPDTSEPCPHCTVYI